MEPWEVALSIAAVLMMVAAVWQTREAREDAAKARAAKARETASLQTALADLQTANEHLEDTKRRLAAHAELTPEQRKVLADPAVRCIHCGGVHAVACPRIKRIRFRGDGQTPLEVEFWETWPTDRVTFPEDVLEMPLEGEVIGA